MILPVFYSFCFRRQISNQINLLCFHYAYSSSYLFITVSLSILDKIYPLPENWPKLPQIFRRRSCELTTTTSPCVNKAVSHLELLQNVIEEWSQEKEEEIRSRQATARG